MASPAELVAQAQQYAGLPYRLGAEAALHSDEPPAALDCSELVQLACARVGIDAPDGTVNQWPWCRDNDTLIGVEQAIATAGALLFIYKGPNSGGGAGNHVAISRGDGTTIEARGRKWGVGNWPAAHRGWTHGALIPGLDYTQHMEADDMDAETFARATGANYNPGTGQITLTLLEDLSADGTATYREYPFATALVFIHQELKMARLRG